VSKDLQTTNDYRIAVDINISAARALSDEFAQAAKGRTLEEFLPSFMETILGRKGVTAVLHEDKGYQAHRYYYAEEEMHLGIKPASFEEKLASFLNVDIDDLPPKIPEELTPELLDYLLVLHELEHATQLSVPRKGDGSIDLAKVTSNLLQPGVSLRARTGAGCTIIAEVDADGAVQAYLHEEGLGNVAEFIMNVRRANFFDVKHDLALIRTHYKETGKVIDPNHYYAERMKLTARVAEEVGIDFNIVGKALAKYPPNVTGKLAEDDVLQKELEESMRVGMKRKVMYVGQALLDKGELSGIAKLRIEEHIKAMKDLGYKPDDKPVADFEGKVQAFLEKHFGQPPSREVNDLQASGSAVGGQEEEAAVVAGSPISTL